MDLTRVDVHHHYAPASLLSGAAIASAWPLPYSNWTPEFSIETMDGLGIQKAILSLPIQLLSAAHEINIAMSEVVAENPDRFGFFANLPIGFGTIDDVLTELDYALDELKADGVMLISSYEIDSNTTYLGNNELIPLWQALHEREAIVFIHGSELSVDPLPSALLPGPIIAVPGETYKTAADIVTSGIKRNYPGAKVILSHCGGSTPFLASRVAVLSNYVGNALNLTTLSIDEILEDLKTFYYESALSGYNTSLLAVESFVDKDHILFGTDFPAITVAMAEWFTKDVDAFFGWDIPFWNQIMNGNWAKLQN